MQTNRIEHHTHESEQANGREGQSNCRRLVFSARQAIRRITNGTLPPGTTIIGNLTFSDAISATIPNDTHIRGSLLMLWMSGLKLGDGLKVDGCADLSMSEIEHFPHRMVVGSDLILMNTTVKKLPADLKVDGLIHLGKYASQQLWERAAEAQQNFEAKHPKSSGLIEEKATIAR